MIDYTYSTASIDSARRIGAAIDARYPVKGKPPTLLTLANPKVAKGAADLGYLPGVLHLAPATMAGVNVCPWSSPECVAGCLNTAGRGGIGLDASGWNAIQAARIRRTVAFVTDPEGFAADLVRSIDHLVRTASRYGLRPALRLNGTSDIAWHRIAPGLVGYAQERGCRMYEYTKRPKPDALAHGIDVTYSYPGGEGRCLSRFIDAGARVAVVFDTRKGHALPDRWQSPAGDVYPVIDGDAHDLRFTDPGGVVVGLRAKGKARNVQGTRFGFVQAA